MKPYYILYPLATIGYYTYIRVGNGKWGMLAQKVMGIYGNMSVSFYGEISTMGCAPGVMHLRWIEAMTQTIFFNNIHRNDFIARLAKLAEDVNTFLLLTGHKT